MPAEFEFGIVWDYKGKRGSHKIWHEAFSRSIRDWKNAFREVIEKVLEPFVTEQFASEGGKGETHWAELAESTLRGRPAGRPILNLTGRLKRSFFGGSEHVETVQDKFMSWGSRTPYAVFHQTGTGVGFRKQRPKRDLPAGRGMPQRPILDFPERPKPGNEFTANMQRVFIKHGRMAAIKEGFRVLGRGEAQGTPIADIQRIGDIALANL